MPRKARVLVPNCPHHVVQRGHNRKAVFLEEQDYRYYLANLQEWSEALGIKVYAWCLMTNYIHLVVEPGDDAFVLSTLMKRINGRQAAYVNALERRSGSLWEGRFKASPIQRDVYLLACIRYVELNPVKAGMVKDLRDYPWSSVHEREAESNEWLVLDESYLALGQTKQLRWKNYWQLLGLVNGSKDDSFIGGMVQRNQLTGNTRFIDEIEQRIGYRVEQRGRGRPTVPDK